MSDKLRAAAQAACSVCNEVHSILDADESQIIRDTKDGYPEGRTPRVLTLQERVTALCRYASDWKNWYLERENTAPPRKEWVGLTDEEITQGNRDSLVDLWAWESAVLWAEAKLREKNT